MPACAELRQGRSNRRPETRVGRWVMLPISLELIDDEPGSVDLAGGCPRWRRLCLARGPRGTDAFGHSAICGNEGRHQVRLHRHKMSRLKDQAKDMFDRQFGGRHSRQSRLSCRGDCHHRDARLHSDTLGMPSAVVLLPQLGRSPAFRNGEQTHRIRRGIGQSPASPRKAPKQPKGNSSTRRWCGDEWFGRLPECRRLVGYPPNPPAICGHLLHRCLAVGDDGAVGKMHCATVSWQGLAHVPSRGIVE